MYHFARKKIIYNFALSYSYYILLEFKFEKTQDRTYVCCLNEQHNF